MKRVVKLGGSLLGWAEWPDACREWLKRQAATNLIIVGGGTPVDAVRRLSAQLHTPAETSHWSAIRAMGATAQLAAAALTEADMVQDVSTIVAGPAATSCYVLEVEHSLRSAHSYAAVPELPASWDVTSDSIAAWVARIRTPTNSCC